MCDGAMLGPSGLKMLGDYNATTRAGIEDDGFRASTPGLRLQDMDRDGIARLGDLRPVAVRPADRRPGAEGRLPARVQRLGATSSTRTTAAACACCRCCRRTRPRRRSPSSSASRALGHRGAIVSPFEFRVSDPAWDGLWAAAAETRPADQLPHRPRHLAGEGRLHELGDGRLRRGGADAARRAAGDDDLLRRARAPSRACSSCSPSAASAGCRTSSAAWTRPARSTCPKATDYQLKAKPSEIFRRQVFATFEEEPLGPQLIPLLGPDNFMWASDYPHPDSTFPHSADGDRRRLRRPRRRDRAQGDGGQLSSAVSLLMTQRTRMTTNGHRGPSCHWSLGHPWSSVRI